MKKTKNQLYADASEYDEINHLNKPLKPMPTVTAFSNLQMKCLSLPKVRQLQISFKYIFL